MHPYEQRGGLMPRGGWTVGRRAIDINEEEIRREYLEKDVSMHEACQMLHCSPKILIAAMRNFGINAKSKTRGIRQGRRLEHQELSDHAWLAKEIETRSFQSIAQEIGMKASGVRSYAIRHGLYEVPTQIKE